MNGFNQVRLIGNLGTDAVAKGFDNGSAVINFSIATQESWKDAQGQKQTTVQWHSCTQNFKNLENAKKVAKFMTKGKCLVVDGMLKYNKKDDKTYAYIHVSNWDFTPGQPKEENQA